MVNMAVQQSKRANAQAGFSLIEAVIVLGIAGLIVGGIWAAASSAYENLHQQDASRNLLALVQNIRNFYAQSGASDTIDTNLSNLQNLSLLPNDMVSGTGSSIALRHPWSGNITVASTTVGSIAAFSLAYGNVKKDSCKNFIARVSNAARGSGLLTVLSNTGTEILNLVANSSQQVDPSSITCIDNGTPTFVFALH